MRSDHAASSEERFDIYDEAEQHIGTASRSEVHAKGYWHRSFHCWLARRENSRQLVMFQLRHAHKDTFPSCFDITAAGHLEAGETMRDAAREIEEELGIHARLRYAPAAWRHKKRSKRHRAGNSFHRS